MHIISGDCQNFSTPESRKILTRKVTLNVKSTIFESLLQKIHTCEKGFKIFMILKFNIFICNQCQKNI